MNTYTRRLQSDWDALRAALREFPRIAIEGTAGNPPQRYHLRYRVKSLEEKPDGSIEERPEHLVEITLTRAYPRQPPLCRMLTPVYHPNIAPHAICIGDHWAAGESLTQLVFRIGEMLSFQSYNVKSPLNGPAAHWAETHLEKLPLDPVPFEVPEPAHPEPAAASAPKTENPADPGIVFHCTVCGIKLSANRAHAGSLIACPSCQSQMIIPQAR